MEKVFQDNGNEKKIWGTNTYIRQNRILLGIYLKKPKTLIWKDECIHMSIAALFTIAKIWKHPKCSSVDKCIKKMWYKDTIEYHSAIKKDLNLAICNNMNGPQGYYDKWSKSDKYHMT